jgi:hypothetical protein
MATLKNTTINDTGFITLPTGTTAQRPVSPIAGMMRFNSTIGLGEYYNGSSWISISPVPTEGLVFFVDAGQSSSYPGSGSTWFDISGYNRNLSLGAGVTYVSQFGGVLEFAENSTGYARLDGSSFNLSNSNNTVISWVRKMNNGNDGRTITAWQNNWLMAHHDNTYGDYYAEGWITEGQGTSDTTWRQFAVTGNTSADIWQSYINDSFIISSSNGSQGPNGWNINSQYDQYSHAQISCIIAWNRVLSATEITGVYNYYRTRFGV